MSGDLIPCPLCGAKCYSVCEDRHSEDPEYSIVCPKCDIKFSGYITGLDESECKSRFNKRAYRLERAGEIRQYLNDLEPIEGLIEHLYDSQKNAIEKIRLKYLAELERIRKGADQ